MTPAEARVVLLHLVLAWLAVLAAWLVRDGLRGLRGGPIRRGGQAGAVHVGRAARVHGAVRVALGAAGLGWVGWLVF